MTNYPVEMLDEDYDDGTMPENVATLSEAVVGHKIASVYLEDPSENDYYSAGKNFIIELDNGAKVRLKSGGACCAYTELEKFLLNVNYVDHIIAGVGTTDGYNTWHIYADMGDVLELTVGWSAGNTGYYGYGFRIEVEELGK